MRRGPGHVPVGAMVAGVALLAVVACKPQVIVVRGMESPDMGMEMRECPHDWDREHGALTGTLPGAITNVPEFHDCQRLRAPDEGYGVLAAVFARDSLGLVKDAEYSAPRGRSVALVYLPPDTNTRFAHTYDTLGLTKRFACVVVRRAPGADEAWVVPVEDGKECWQPTALRATASASPLDLHVLDSPIEGQGVPPVARWDWDSSTSTQYIGVRCGTKWCEVGVKGFRSSAGHDPGAEAGEARRGYAMRGAYDEQRLAEFDAEGLRSAMNLGTVVPTPELVAFSTSGPKPGDWTPVARTHLFPDAGKYEAKFNFAASRVSPTDARASTVSLCLSTTEAPCAPLVRRTVLDLSECEVVRGTADNRWVARVDRPGAGSAYYCVRYKDHGMPGFTIPPVVRWRWRADDETIWISCPQGCCEVNAET